jgi:hypothetical protein
MAQKKNKNKYQSTQKYLDIFEIKDDVVIMKDGTIRAILLVSSINFALKSEDEQEAIISSYVSCLNNINFPLQIVIQSRKMDIDDYIIRLKQKEKEQTNELLKMQINEYIQYVQELVLAGNIMSKRFYVSISYNPLSDKHKNFFTSLKEVFKPASLIRLKEERFFKHKKELERKVDKVINNLSSIGLNVVPLDTQSLIELFYNTYNPGTYNNEKMIDINQIKVI